MSEWKEYKLGEIANIQTGPFGSQLHQSDYVDVGIPSIMPVNIGDRMNISTEKIVYITEEDATRLSRYRVQEGDIVYSRRGDVEKCAYIGKAEIGWLCGTGCLRIRIDSSKADSKFIAYYLSTEDIKNWISNNAVGTTMPNLNSSILQQVPLSMPSLDEQIRIASILSSLDDKIDLLNRENATLEAMAATLFRQWFIEEAKEDWEEVPFGTAIEVFDYKRKPLSKMERDKMKVSTPLYPYYGAAEIMDYINSYLFDGEYILMGEDGTVKTDDGYPILQYATGKFWPNNHTHVIQAKYPYNNCFIWNYLNTTNIENIVTGAVQPKINQANMLSLPFYSYPIRKIEEYQSITQPWWNKTIKNKEQISSLIKQRNILLPKLMTKEIQL